MSTATSCRDSATQEIVSTEPSSNQEKAENIINIKKLNLGRIDLWAYGEDVAMGEIETNWLNVEEYETVFILSAEDLYFAFHKDTPDAVLQTLQAALDALKAEGKFDKILDRYLK